MIDLVLMLALGMESTGDDAFLRLREEWARNLKEKRVEAWVAEYAPDGEFLQPNGERVKGPDALRRLFETITKTLDSDLVYTASRVESSGDLTYDSGTYRETLVTRATGEKQEMQGSYLTVYRRGKDGAWLIVEQVWTGGPSEGSPR